LTTCTSGALCWLRDFSFAGNWLLIVAGWVVVNYQTNARERRKEVRGIVDATEKLILELEVSARKYYALAGTSIDAITLALEIKAGMRTLSSRMKVLRLLSPQFDGNDALIGYRTAVTGGDFESSGRPACPADHRVFAEISAGAGALVNFLNERYATL
jgi:hypothetical protein